MHTSVVDQDVEVACLWFMDRDARYEREKPFVSNYRQWSGFLPTNVKHTPRDGIIVRNLRDYDLTYEDNGICLMPMLVDMDYADYDDNEKVECILLPQLREQIKLELGASDVHILEYRIRRRTEGFPQSMGDCQNYAQPALAAHVVDEIVKEVREFDKDKWLHNRVQALNAWAPLKGPLRDWPLCVCDSATVGLEDDLQETDVLCPDKISENFQLHFSGRQRWFHVKDHMPHEWLLFRAVDSAKPRFAAVPHCAFQCAQGVNNDMRRESIEIRMLVLHDEPRVH